MGARSRAALGSTVLALSVAAVAGAGAGAAISPTRAHQVVAEMTARNKARARRAAERQLDEISLPPGAAASAGRPSGIGGRLEGPAVFPGGSPHVAAHRFWTVPGTARRTLAWIRRHPPPRAIFEGTVSSGDGTFTGSESSLIFESVPGPRHPREQGGLLFVTAVRRSSGGSAVRADMFEDWEWPRSPLDRIPPGSRFLGVRVSPGSGGIHAEGEVQPAASYASTADRRLIANLVRLINRQPVYQEIDVPSCGPPGLGSEYRLFTFTFRTSRHGRVLARVSQETPFGICSAMVVRLGSHRSFALEGGRALLLAARGLIAPH